MLKFTPLFATTLLLAHFLQAEPAQSSNSGAKTDDSGHVRIPLQVTKNIKAVYQVSDDKTKDGMAKALVYAKKLIDTYHKNGISDEEIELHLVFHGEATKALVNDATRERLAAEGGAANPNREIVAELIKRGVKIELCESSMQQHEVAAKDLLEKVTIVVGAYPRLIELQLLGFPYIKFE